MSAAVIRLQAGGALSAKAANGQPAVADKSRLFMHTFNEQFRLFCAFFLAFSPPSPGRRRFL